MPKQIGWSNESNLLYTISSQISRLAGVIAASGGGGGGTITGGGAAGQITFWDAATNITGSNNLFWDAAQSRLGIGTNTPSNLVDVRFNSNLTNGIFVTNSSTGNGARAIIRLNNDSSNIGQLSIWGSGTTLANKTFFEASKDFVIGTDCNTASGGTSKFQVYVAGYNNATSPQLTLHATGNLSLGSTTDDGVNRLQVQGSTLLNGNVTFSSSTGMFWDATNSRLGIGTNAPAFVVDVAGNVDGIFRQHIKNSSTGTSAQSAILLRNNADTQYMFGVTSTSYTTVAGLIANDAYVQHNDTLNTYPNSGLVLKTSNANPLKFQTNNVERGRFFAGGNFALGSTTDSGERLQVTGDVKITGKLALTVVTNRQTANYSLVLADNGKLVETNVGAANTITVPPNSSIAFPIGSKIDLAQYGAGQTTIVPGIGVTVRSAGGALKLSAQYSGATIVKIGTDEWYLFGDITV